MATSNSENIRSENNPHVPETPQSESFEDNLALSVKFGTDVEKLPQITTGEIGSALGTKKPTTDVPALNIPPETDPEEFQERPEQEVRPDPNTTKEISEYVFPQTDSEEQQQHISQDIEIVRIPSNYNIPVLSSKPGVDVEKLQEIITEEIGSALEIKESKSDAPVLYIPPGRNPDEFKKQIEEEMRPETKPVSEASFSLITPETVLEKQQKHNDKKLDDLGHDNSFLPLKPDKDIMKLQKDSTEKTVPDLRIKKPTLDAPTVPSGLFQKKSQLQIEKELQSALGISKINSVPSNLSPRPGFEKEECYVSDSGSSMHLTQLRVSKESIEEQLSIALGIGNYKAIKEPTLETIVDEDIVQMEGSRVEKSPKQDSGPIAGKKENENLCCSTKTAASGFVYIVQPEKPFKKGKEYNEACKSGEFGAIRKTVKEQITASEKRSCPVTEASTSDGFVIIQKSIKPQIRSSEEASMSEILSTEGFIMVKNPKTGAQGFGDVQRPVQGQVESKEVSSDTRKVSCISSEIDDKRHHIVHHGSKGEIFPIEGNTQSLIELLNRKDANLEKSGVKPRNVSRTVSQPSRPLAQDSGLVFARDHFRKEEGLNFVQDYFHQAGSVEEGAKAAEEIFAVPMTPPSRHTPQASTPFPHKEPQKTAIINSDLDDTRQDNVLQEEDVMERSTNEGRDNSELPFEMVDRVLENSLEENSNPLEVADIHSVNTSVNLASQCLVCNSSAGSSGCREDDTRATGSDNDRRTESSNITTIADGFFFQSPVQFFRSSDNLSDHGLGGYIFSQLNTNNENVVPTHYNDKAPVTCEGAEAEAEAEAVGAGVRERTPLKYRDLDTIPIADGFLYVTQEKQHFTSWEGAGVRERTPSNISSEHHDLDTIPIADGFLYVSQGKQHFTSLEGTGVRERIPSNISSEHCDLDTIPIADGFLYVTQEKQHFTSLDSSISLENNHQENPTLEYQGPVSSFNTKDYIGTHRMGTETDNFYQNTLDQCSQRLIELKMISASGNCFRKHSLVENSELPLAHSSMEEHPSAEGNDQTGDDASSYQFLCGPLPFESTSYDQFSNGLLYTKRTLNAEVKDKIVSFRPYADGIAVLEPINYGEIITLPSDISGDTQSQIIFESPFGNDETVSYANTAQNGNCMPLANPLSDQTPMTFDRKGIPDQRLDYHMTPNAKHKRNAASEKDLYVDIEAGCETGSVVCEFEFSQSKYSLPTDKYMLLCDDKDKRPHVLPSVQPLSKLLETELGTEADKVEKQTKQSKEKYTKEFKVNQSIIAGQLENLIHQTKEYAEIRELSTRNFQASLENTCMAATSIDSLESFHTSDGGDGDKSYDLFFSITEPLYSIPLKGNFRKTYHTVQKADFVTYPETFLRSIEELKDDVILERCNENICKNVSTIALAALCSTRYLSSYFPGNSSLQELRRDLQNLECKSQQITKHLKYSPRTIDIETAKGITVSTYKNVIKLISEVICKLLKLRTELTKQSNTEDDLCHVNTSIDMMIDNMVSCMDDLNE